MTERILVVDDEKEIADLLVLLLEPVGWPVDIAHSLKGATALMQQNLYPIILLDIRLPDGEGSELIPRLKSFNPFAQVIMMTAFTSMEYVVRCLELGAVDYFTKPFRDVDAVLGTIRVAQARIARWRAAIPMYPR